MGRFFGKYVSGERVWKCISFFFWEFGLEGAAKEKVIYIILKHKCVTGIALELLR